MINNTTQYINVSYTLTVKRGIFQVILDYYINGKRKQPWRSLHIEDKPRKQDKGKKQSQRNS